MLARMLFIIFLQKKNLNFNNQKRHHDDEHCRQLRQNVIGRKFNLIASIENER